MSDYYVPMSDEQIEKVKYDTIVRYSDLKKRKAGLNAQIAGWRRAFNEAGQQLGDPLRAAVSTREWNEIPEGEEVRMRLMELRNVVKELEEATAHIKELGLDIS